MRGPHRRVQRRVLRLRQAARHRGDDDEALQLADEANLKGKINAMFLGEHLNSTEDRAVLHVATRAPRAKVINVDGKNVPDVWDVLDKIKDFTEKARTAVARAHRAGHLLVAIGIGGSSSVPLRAHRAAHLRRGGGGRWAGSLLPTSTVDVARSLNVRDFETTLVVVVSKTFTTAETMLNARTVRQWIIASSARRLSRSTWSRCQPTSSSSASSASTPTTRLRFGIGSEVGTPCAPRWGCSRCRSSTVSKRWRSRKGRGTSTSTSPPRRSRRTFR